MIFQLPSRKANSHYVISEGKSLQQLLHHILTLIEYVPGILPAFLGIELDHRHCKSRVFLPSHSKESILMLSNTESWRKGVGSWLFPVLQRSQVRNAVTADGPAPSQVSWVSTTFLWLLLFFRLVSSAPPMSGNFFWCFWDCFTWAKGLFLFLLFYFPRIQLFFSYLAFHLLRFIFPRF